MKKAWELIKSIGKEVLIQKIAGWLTLGVFLGSSLSLFSSRVRQFLGTKIQIEIWVFSILLIVLITCAILLIYSWVLHHVSNDCKCYYNEDVFYGIKWRWSYNKYGQVVGLTAYCLRCDVEATLHEVPAAFAILEPRGTMYKCCGCGAERFLDGEYDLYNKVTRLIDRNNRKPSK